MTWTPWRFFMVAVAGWMNRQQQSTGPSDQPVLPAHARPLTPIPAMAQEALTRHDDPHQLRHNAATELRKEFGIEAARIILGHRSAAITEVYAERDEQEAIEAMAQVG